MASYTYPPIVSSSAPAFEYNNGEGIFKLYFKKSSYVGADYVVNSIYISITNQKDGSNALNRKDGIDSSGNKRYRTTGQLILGSWAIKADENGDQYIAILGEDIKKEDSYGWTSGNIYKFQIRLSNQEYNTQKSLSQMGRTGAFTEWSTYCSAKCITKPIIQIPIFDYIDNEIIDDNEENIYNLASEFQFSATYIPGDDNDGENLYSYNIKLYEDDDPDPVDDSGDLYPSLANNSNKMDYFIKYLFQESSVYKLVLTYITQNKYTNKIENSFTVMRESSENYPIKIAIAEDVYNYHNIDGYHNESENDISTQKEAARKKLLNAGVTVDRDNDEGRVSIALYSDSDELLMQSFVLRRTDSKSGYTLWEDIKIINCNNIRISEVDIIYDYTIESGLYYKYAVQPINSKGYRGTIDDDYVISVIRNFNYSFLLGKGGKQLRLKFNNTMDNYTYTILEQKTDTIGNKYPYIYRNNDVKYRTFPVKGLISYNMDDNLTFTNNTELYGKNKLVLDETGKYVDKWENVINQYTDLQNKYKSTSKYDFKHEFDFREKVLSFLQDGQPKLFKSPTEGNIIVYLTNVSEQPDTTTSRLIGSFTSIAYEIDDNTMSNYLKYGFYNNGVINEDYITYKYELGQIELSVAPNDSSIIRQIWNKYDTSKINNYNYRYTLEQIEDVKIEFLSKPLKVTSSSGDQIVGNNLSSSKSDNLITVNSLHGRFYEFDDNITFNKNDIIKIHGSNDGNKDNIHVLINFIYKIKQEPYALSMVAVKTYLRNIGQYNGIFIPSTKASYNPNTNLGYSLYKDIYLKYYSSIVNDDGEQVESKNLTSLESVAIEAPIGAVFVIKDRADETAEITQKHIMNETGLLVIDEFVNISDICYQGIYNFNTKTIENKQADIILNYIYFVTKSFY